MPPYAHAIWHNFTLIYFGIHAEKNHKRSLKRSQLYNTYNSKSRKVIMWLILLNGNIFSFQTYALQETSVKPDETVLDETGFSFVSKCITALEDRGSYHNAKENLTRFTWIPRQKCTFANFCKHVLKQVNAILFRSRGTRIVPGRWSRIKGQ